MFLGYLFFHLVYGLTHIYDFDTYLEGLCDNVYCYSLFFVFFGTFGRD